MLARGSAGVVVFAMVLLITDVANAILIGLTMLCIDACLFGWMALLSMPIDTLTYISLAISIGVSVDYVIHVAHCFEYSTGTPRERAANAVVRITSPLLRAGLSDFLGMCFLTFMDSPAFVEFFKMFAAVIALGHFGGLVFYPGMASLLGCLITPSRAVVALPVASEDRTPDSSFSLSQVSLSAGSR